MALLQKNNQKTRANVVDGKIILTCPNAQTPVVWQMDLTEASASALEVRNEGGQSVLMLKTLKGKEATIAVFDTREKALDVLMAASHALQNAHGKMRAPANSNALHAPMREVHAKKGGWFKKIFMFLAVLALLYVALSFILVMTGPQRTSSNSAQTSQNSGGTAMSADDYLSGR
jgi:hypothetical protein